MERNASLSEAMEIFGSDLLGPIEFRKISDLFPISIPDEIPEIPFTTDFLKIKKGAYLLVLGLSRFEGRITSIRNLRNFFGIDPEIQEPCFYNQDWYLNEGFIDEELEQAWYLLSKVVLEDTRAVMPQTLELNIKFPKAVVCTYAFFVFWLCRNQILWKNDFIWCSDTDQNGDKIYVGKYIDISGINKNGFSIHRHLRIRECYAAIDIVY